MRDFARNAALDNHSRHQHSKRRSKKPSHDAHYDTTRASKRWLKRALAALLLLAACVVTYTYLKKSPSPVQTETEAKTSHSTAHVEATPTAPAVLPDHTHTVEAPKPALAPPPETAQPKFSFYSSLTKEAVPVEEVVDEKKYRYTYMLQVGSYKTDEAANAMRARLLLIGLQPKLKKIGSWYRIDVGPVYSKREGDILKHKLQAAQISGSMLRQVDKQLIAPTEKST